MPVAVPGMPTPNAAAPFDIRPNAIAICCRLGCCCCPAAIPIVPTGVRVPFGCCDCPPVPPPPKYGWNRLLLCCCCCCWPVPLRPFIAGPVPPPPPIKLCGPIAPIAAPFAAAACVAIPSAKPGGNIGHPAANNGPGFECVFGIVCAFDWLLVFAC